MKKALLGTLVAVLVALLVGTAIGWWLGQRQQVLHMALSYELEMSGMCANGLKLASEDSPDRLVALLEYRLDSAIQHMSALMDDGVRLHPTASNLTDSLRRASEYYEGTGDTKHMQTADALLAQLSSSK
jgi:hypothetical protein